ncbi:MAG: hypothetical protein OXQ94_16310 [Gemmatimonadota bacterium]|nr:hypothetical protein [Gemmatimonadota bacterium]
MAHHRTYQSVLKRAAAARRSPRTTQRGRILMATLALLAVAQTAAVGKRMVGSGTREAEIATGHDLSAVSLRRANGTLAGLGDGHRTLLLVFDPECAHSRRLADDWREWLGTTRDDGVRVFALSAGSPASTAAYAREQQWHVEVASIAGATGRDEVHFLTRRAPWVFAVGGDGRVLASGHGRKLAEVAGSPRTTPPRHSTGDAALHGSGSSVVSMGRGEVLASRRDGMRHRSERKR